MAGGRRGRLAAFLVLVFGGTVAGVLLQEPSDGVLRVEGWAPEIRRAAAEAGLAEPWLLAGLVLAESRGRPEALSPAGAAGLGQLLPGTADEVADRHGIPGPPFAPGDNLRLAARYLAFLLERWQGDRDLALLSYRLGPARVARELEAAGGREAWLASLRRRKPSPWDYRTQVLRFAARFQERAAAGIPAWREDGS